MLTAAHDHAQAARLDLHLNGHLPPQLTVADDRQWTIRVHSYTPALQHRHLGVVGVRAAEYARKGTDEFEPPDVADDANLQRPAIELRLGRNAHAAAVARAIGHGHHHRPGLERRPDRDG